MGPTEDLRSGSTQELGSEEAISTLLYHYSERLTRYHKAISFHAYVSYWFDMAKRFQRIQQSNWENTNGYVLL